MLTNAVFKRETLYLQDIHPNFSSLFLIKQQAMEIT